MKLKSQTAHGLLQNFVAWHRIGGRIFPMGYGQQPIAELATEGYRETKNKSELEPWFTDDHAAVANAVLSELLQERPLEGKVVIYYYFVGQRQDLTAEKFRRNPAQVDTLVNAGLGWLDGRLAAKAS